MLQRLQERLNNLKAEFTRGQERLAQLEAESSRLRETLLRISGAVQVLEEEISKADPAHGEGARTPASPGADEPS
jgi:predicted nuclease with TOPRIM domain